MGTQRDEEPRSSRGHGHPRSGIILADEPSEERGVDEGAARLRTVMANAPVLLFALDANGVFTSYDGRGLEEIGRTRAELIGHSAVELFGALDFDDANHGKTTVSAVLARALSGEYVAGILEFHLGSFEFRLIPRTNDDGELIEIAGIAVNVTRRARAERELQEERRRRDDASRALERSEQSFRTLIEALPDLVVVHRGNHVVYVNPVVVRALGYDSADDLVGRELRELVAYGEIDLFAGDLPFPPARTREVHLARRDGGVRAVEIDTQLIDFDGLPSRLIVARDVTTRNETTSQLLHRDRMVALGTLATGVAHEINNPMTYVLGNVEYVLRKLRSRAAAGESQDDQTLVPSLVNALQGLDRMRHIVRDLMTFSQSSPDRKALVDVRGVLESSLQMAWHEIRHRARVVKQLNDVPPVEANEARLGQVFLNLLINAAHAVPEGHAAENEVRVVTRVDDDGMVVVEVKDTGVGIAPEVLPRVFDPFFTTKRAGEGLGLGLSISHGVVRDLGGAIALESVPGRGTTFRVTLPSAKGFRRVSSPNLKCASVPPPPSRVLIVDDDPLVAESLALTLRGENEVTVSTSPREVLEILARGEEYDVILCDLLMPEMAGADLYAELLRTAPSAVGRIVFMTGGALSARTRAFVEGIGKTCLAKPLDARELRDLVRSRSRATACP